MAVPIHGYILVISRLLVCSRACVWYDAMVHTRDGTCAGRRSQLNAREFRINKYQCRSLLLSTPARRAVYDVLLRTFDPDRERVCVWP